MPELVWVRLSLISDVAVCVVGNYFSCCRHCWEGIFGACQWQEAEKLFIGSVGKENVCREGKNKIRNADGVGSI